MYFKPQPPLIALWFICIICLFTMIVTKYVPLWAIFTVSFMGTTDAALYNKAGGMSSFANILEPSIFSVVFSNNVLMSNIDTRITHICIYALQHYLYLKCGTCYILTVHKFTWHVYLHPLNLHIPISVFEHIPLHLLSSLYLLPPHELMHYDAVANTS